MSQHLDAVKKLHTRLIDSRDGYGAAAPRAEDPFFATLFERLSQQRGQFAGRVRSQLLAEGRELDDDGSILASAHRSFTGLRDRIGSGDAALLAEIVRGEEHLLEAYDAAQRAAAGQDGWNFLPEQRVAVASELDELRSKRSAA